jgi:hypothetical protein
MVTRSGEVSVESMPREQAARLLGLRGRPDPQAVKRAYRRLARENHPDAGGDAEVFVALRAAYERLLDEPPPPAVSRGRPSRVSDASTKPKPAGARVDFSAGEPAPGDPLDRDRLVVRLARRPDDPLVATSRAPGSPLNRVAVHLAGDLSARMRIGPGTDDRGAPVIGVEVRAGIRRARRALDRAPLEGVWVRRRNPSTTVLATTVVPSTESATGAERVADRLADLLDSIGWPLSTWRMLSNDDTHVH